MRCDTTRAALLDFLNGELGFLPAWAIRRHLTTCASCRAELAALRGFTQTLRRADLVPPEPAVVLRPHRTPRRRVLATAAALLVAGLLILLPTLHQNHQAAQNPGAAIAAALGRVNTWHFSGWKLIDGQEVPWEVWGRRTPFLYYERVGEAVSWSDGKQFVRVFPPNAALNRPHGLIIKTIPDETPGGGGFLDDPAYRVLAATYPTGANFGDGFTTLYAQTLTEARFREQYSAGVSEGVNANKLYLISKHDWLPTTYQLHYDSKTFERDTEFLTVRYGSALPDAVLAPPAADGYSVVDLSSEVSRPDGFRVTATPVAIDKAGNLVISARGWLGGNPLTPGSLFSLDVQPHSGMFTATRRSQLIKYLYATNFAPIPGGEILMPFTPLEPSEVATGLPDTFSLSMQATPQLLVRGSDRVDSDGTLRPSTHAENLLAKQFTWRLSVPKPVATLPVKFPSSINVAEVRRIYYYMGYDYTYTALKQLAPQLARTGVITKDGFWTTDGPASKAVEALKKRHPAVFLAAKHKFRARAAYWQAQKLALMSQGEALDWQRGNLRVHYAYDLQLLALCYQMAGDTAKRNHTLRRLLVYLKGDASFGVLRRQAIYSLHTGSFPGDLGYKGP